MNLSLISVSLRGRRKSRRPPSAITARMKPGPRLNDTIAHFSRLQLSALRTYSYPTFLANLERLAEWDIEVSSLQEAYEPLSRMICNRFLGLLLPIVTIVPRFISKLASPSTTITLLLLRDKAIPKPMD